jgi:hypothetical protein
VSRASTHRAWMRGLRTPVFLSLVNNFSCPFRPVALPM